MIRTIIRIPILFIILALFTMCEYDEGDDSSRKKTPPRLSSITVSGSIDTIQSEKYLYNDDGYLTSIIKEDSEGNRVTTMFEYNKNSEIMRETRIKNNTILVTTYDYDDGRRIFSETVELSDDREIIQDKVFYYYDSKGLLSKKEVNDPSGASRGTVTFMYEEAPVKGVGKELAKYKLLFQ